MTDIVEAANTEHPKRIVLCVSMACVLYMLIVCTFGLLGGAWMIADDDVGGRFTFVVFAFGLLIAISFVMFPTKFALELSEEGYAIRTLFVRFFYRWSDVADIQIARIAGPLSSKVVHVTFTQSYLANHALYRLFYQRALLAPFMYGISAERLQEIMVRLFKYANEGTHSAA